MDKNYKLYSNKTSLIRYTYDVLERSRISPPTQTGTETKERSTLQSVIIPIIINNVVTNHNKPASHCKNYFHGL